MMPLLLLLLVSLGHHLVQAQPVDQIWSTAQETQANWKEYPKELQKRIDGEAEALVNKVNMRVFQIFPEPGKQPRMPSQRVWPLLKGMVPRMDGILRPRVSYYLEGGERFGCREDDHEVVSDHCKRHCTHGGRYCAPQIQDELRPGRHGKDVVQEVLRRLCVDDLNVDHFLAYLQEYETLDCFGKPEAHDVEACATHALTKAGINAVNIEQCVKQVQGDQVQPLLHANLASFQKPSMHYKKSHMPQIDIDGRPLMPHDYGLDIRQWSTRQIFDKYCEAFPYCEYAANQGKPLACQVCDGCQDVQTCLWNLQCDGKPINTTAALEAPPNTIPVYTCKDEIPDRPHAPAPKPLQTPTQPVQQESQHPALVYFKIAIAGVVLLVVGLAAVYCYRRRQARLRQANILKRSIPPEMSYSDHNRYSDEQQPSFEFGQSARKNKGPPTNAFANMAPRPSEDQDNMVTFQRSNEMDQSLDDIDLRVDTDVFV